MTGVYMFDEVLLPGYEGPLRQWVQPAWRYPGLEYATRHFLKYRPDISGVLVTGPSGERVYAVVPGYRT